MLENEASGKTVVIFLNHISNLDALSGCRECCGLPQEKILLISASSPEQMDEGHGTSCQKSMPFDSTTFQAINMLP